MEANNRRILRVVSFLLVVHLLGAAALSQGIDPNDAEPGAWTNRYVFVAEQSTIFQTGGFAGVHWTYAIEGQFVLSVDPNTATASFAHVDANAIDETEPARTLDPNEAFNLTGLVGAVLDDQTIEFQGKIADSSDVRLTLTFEGDLVYLTGQTTAPPNSADFFLFHLDATAKRKYAGGTGEPNNPYLISTPEQMNAIGADPNDWDKHFKLTADIDLAVYQGTEFNIIGYGYSYLIGKRPFAGVFDGNGHRVLNFAWSSSDGVSFVGLFGYVDAPHAEIRNLGLIAPKVEVTAEGSNHVGSLVGSLYEGRVVNCYTEDAIVRGEDTVGALVGRTGRKSLIKDCHATGTVMGSSSTGGLLGRNCGIVTNCQSTAIVNGGGYTGGLVGTGDRDGALIGCYAAGTVAGTSRTGGLIGDNSQDVTGCYSSAVVTGTEYVGGLVGYNYGAISYSHSTGAVSGGNDTGGLVGYSRGGRVPAMITNCYSTATVTGTVHVGGLVGYSSYVITNCYSVGAVTGDAYAGGLTGYDAGGRVTTSFWDTEASGVLTSAAGEGKTTTEMQMANTFLAAGWDFVDETENGTEDIWSVDEGADYPRLVWTSPYGGGTGHPGDPYLIYTAEHLNAIGANRHHRDKHFVLMADVDLGVYSEREFNIIGGPSASEGFKGVFEGNGHAISNFTLADPGRSNVGLFAGVTGASAEVRNVRLIEPSVNAETSIYVGTLVGNLREGTVRNCCAERAIVRGRDYTGGLVGLCHDGTITNSFSTGVVEGGDRTGGLVGVSAGGAIINCYSHSDATGEFWIGGLAGHKGHGTMTNCYATGSVTGWGLTGGLASEDTGNIVASFWNIEMSDELSGTAGTGLTTAEMQTAGTFLEAGWDFVGEVENGTDDIWWILEGQDYPRLWWESADAEF